MGLGRKMEDLGSFLLPVAGLAASALQGWGWENSASLSKMEGAQKRWHVRVGT